MNASSVNTTGARGPIEVEGGSAAGRKGLVENTSLMPEPRQVDVSMAIAQLVIENAFDARKTARQDRQHAAESMVAAQEAQVAQLREQAEQNLSAAAFEAYGKIGAGLMTVVSAAVPKNDKEGAAGVKGAGELFAGGCSLRAAFYKHDADESSVKAKTAEMEVTRQKEAIDNADDGVDEAREHVRTALNFLREFKSTEAQSMSSAIRA